MRNFSHFRAQIRSSCDNCHRYVQFTIVKLYWECPSIMLMIRSLKVGCILVILITGLLANNRLTDPVSNFQTAEATPTPAPIPAKRPYSEFSHDVKEHKVDCGSCHKFPSSNWDKIRTGSDAFPDITEYPKHDSCLNCHKEQFFKGTPPAICSICHVSPSPENSSRHPFPNPRELFDKSPKGARSSSKFAVAFPHDKHVDIVSDTRNRQQRNAAFFVRASTRRYAEESCAVCHKTLDPQGDSKDEYFKPPPKDIGDRFWLKRGTFKSSPIGHQTCFSCHSADSGMSPAPSDCGTCHKPLQPPLGSDLALGLVEKIGISDKVLLTAWRRRDSSGTFRHEWMSHAELSCATCHNVTAINTADLKTKKVPVTSCGPCHITPTAADGGILNFEIDARKKDPKFECVKCHLSFGKAPIPASHTQAVTDAKGN